jgi:hypothetical protein
MTVEDKIGYLSECDKDYCRLVGVQKTLKKLRKFIRSYEVIAADALEVVDKMTEDDFVEWFAGVTLEKKKQFAGEQFVIKYGAVLLPAVILRIGIIAHEFGVPFGVAYIRAREAGLLVEDERGIASIQETG